MKRDPYSCSWRIPPNLWLHDRAFAVTREFLLRHIETVDEVMLFLSHSGDHPAYQPLDEAGADLAIARERMKSLRESGVNRVGINVLSTLGHSDSNDEVAAAMPFQGMTNPAGHASTHCACPNDPRHRDYIKHLYRLVAESGPDFIWVDDDFRLVWHGAADFGCFCPICLEKCGGERDREALIQGFNDPAQGDLRLRWSEFMAASMAELARDIREAIRETAPAVEIGLMSGGYRFPTYGNHDIRRWAKALDARLFRPGDGCWTDRQAFDLPRKILDVGMQIRQMGDGPAVIQHEIEGYPELALEKSLRMVDSESELGLFAGSNGIAVNVLSWEQLNTLDEYTPKLRSYVERRPLYEEIVQRCEGTRWGGLWLAHSNQLMARRHLKPGENWFDQNGYWPFLPLELATIGLPLTPWREHACGTILAGRVTEALTDSELEKLLSGGVLMDGDALVELWRRGFGELTGVRLSDTAIRSDAAEEANAHPLNGADAGCRRDIHIGLGFAGGTQEVRPLELIDAAAEPLAHLDRMRSAGIRGISLARYVNRLGGRVAVAAYSPWSYLGRAWKRRQMLALADWLCGGLPVTVESFAPVMPLVRLDASGAPALISLLNTGFDPVRPLRLHLRGVTAACGIEHLTAAGSTPLASTPEGDGVRVELDELEPFGTATISVK